MIDQYMAEFEAALRTRGPKRRRIVEECREHLVDLATERGEADAVRVFGEPTEIASVIDAEIAGARGQTATWWSVVALLATAFSTLEVIHAADAGATGAVAWAIIFFASAQIATVAGGLALLQAIRLRRQVAEPADIALLARRNLCAIGAAAMTLFSSAAAVPGNGSAVAILIGPTLLLPASFSVGRSARLARRLRGGREYLDRSPFADATAALRGVPVPEVGPVPVAIVAALAAALRESGELGASGRTVVVSAVVEAALVLGAYYSLRTPLGLRSTR